MIFISPSGGYINNILLYTKKLHCLQRFKKSPKGLMCLSIEWKLYTTVLTQL